MKGAAPPHRLKHDLPELHALIRSFDGRFSNAKRREKKNEEEKSSTPRKEPKAKIKNVLRKHSRLARDSGGDRACP